MTDASSQCCLVHGIIEISGNKVRVFVFFKGTGKEITSYHFEILDYLPRINRKHC